MKWAAGLLLTSGEYWLIWSTSQNTFSVHISLIVRENDRWLFSVLSLQETLLPSHSCLCAEKTHCLLPVVSWLPVVIIVTVLCFYIAMSVNVTSVVFFPECGPHISVQTFTVCSWAAVMWTGTVWMRCICIVTPPRLRSPALSRRSWASLKVSGPSSNQPAAQSQMDFRHFCNIHLKELSKHTGLA